MTAAYRIRASEFHCGGEHGVKPTSSMRYPLFYRALFVALALFALPSAGAAQRQIVQAGLAVIPGAGVQVGYVGVRSIYTVEGILYTDISPGFGDGEGSVQVSGGLGGAVRPLGVLRTIGNANPRYDLDVGLRFGPSLFFATNATRSDKNQQFRLVLEPFVRFTSRLQSGRLVYAELGTLRPVLRAGLWIQL